MYALCEKETVEHLFIKCDITKTFWEKYSEWRYNASRKPENLTTEIIMLGISISELPVEEIFASYTPSILFTDVNIENKNQVFLIS